MNKTDQNQRFIYGIDLGSYYTVVSKCTLTANDCKIDILQNSLFRRITPY